MSFTESVKFSWMKTLLTLICLLVFEGPMVNMIIMCNTHLVGSLTLLLSWRPSIMERELAGSTSSLSSSYRQ